MPGIRLSTTTRSNWRSAIARSASRAFAASATSWPSSLRARPRRFRIFSSSSTSRIDPRTTVMPRAPAGRRGRSMRTSVPTCRWLRTTMLPPRPSMMFLAIGRPRPVPARRVVK